MMNNVETIKGGKDEWLWFTTNAADVDGLVAEFGVHKGASINKLAKLVNRTVHGFDSFEGLPEDWVRAEDTTVPQGKFKTDIPEVEKNVELHVGYFEDSLPLFLAEHPGPLSYANIDCDLYNSTKTILTLMNERIVPGTILVFDEYRCWKDDNVYPNWQEHEHKALTEWLEEFDRKVEAIAIDTFQSGAFKVTK